MSTVARILAREGLVRPGKPQKFDRFRKEFNEERPHEALAMKQPAQVYHLSTRPMPKRIESYDYPSHYLVRRDNHHSLIRSARPVRLARAS